MLLSNHLSFQTALSELEFYLILASPQEQNDNALVNTKAEYLDYSGIIILAILAVVVVGIISRKVEYALLFAAALTAFLMALYFF